MTLVTGVLLIALLQPQPHHDAIRYVSLKGCPLICGDWRLTMHSGREVRLEDARTAGDPSNMVAAPIAVSGDGHHVAYVGRSNKTLYVWKMGEKRVAVPGTTASTLKLSQNGGLLAAGGDGDVQVVDTTTGRTLWRAAEQFVGFGGSLTLTSRLTADKTTELTVRSPAGAVLRRIVPPQVVAANAPLALSPDGRHVALTVNRLLFVYDLAADQVRAGVPVKLPEGVSVIDWTGADTLTVHAERARKVTVMTYDVRTGAGQVRETYKIKADAFTAEFCGG
ncbi:hypothetical protein [Nonomuraea soli]|uniref:PQQ-binding-like beta-propeller repeat protein n=1 Tax=Nonomuraea soli TaxID=1032476 RepID=A0A7W0CL54_9ACTN|nr:hypothetical protein [Nonomuraea soli]MBA2893101.1 hypothetical protein [Nonomuraea soli]